MSLNAITWGIASLIAGAWSDRIGRRVFLVAAPVALAVSCVGVAASPAFAGVALWAAIGGAAAGCVTTVVAAEVSARVEDRQRGRALGGALAGQSLALLVGVPGAALLGEALGWRGVQLALAGATLTSALVLFAVTGASSAGTVAAKPRGAARARALTPRVWRLLAITIADRACFALAITFYATFLQATYDLPVRALAVPLAVFALGTILGTLLGGQLADRLPDRLLSCAGAMAGGGLIAMPLFLWTPGLVASVLLGFAFVLVLCVARPCLMAALSAVPDEVRGTVLGLNVTAASVGWLAAAALGGAIIAAWGFAGLAPFAAAGAIAGAALCLTGRRSP
jgi:predicted MFS family arabinose efflux permease